VSPSTERVVAGSVSRVATSMPNLLLWLRHRRDLSRHRCPGWAAPRSQTTCRKSMMCPPTRQNSYRSTSPPSRRLEVTTPLWQVTSM
jgi:hypothetical protein